MSLLNNIDKCTESYTLKIHEILKVNIDKLSPSQKIKLKEEVLIVAAKHIHSSKFDYSQYLSTEGL